MIQQGFHFITFETEQVFRRSDPHRNLGRFSVEACSSLLSGCRESLGGDSHRPGPWALFALLRHPCLVFVAQVEHSMSLCPFWISWSSISLSLE